VAPTNASARSMGPSASLSSLWVQARSGSRWVQALYGLANKSLPSRQPQLFFCSIINKADLFLPLPSGKQQRQWRQRRVPLSISHRQWR
jgi:hypothetical protein